MTRYISKAENLKLMMNLLRDKSPNIQFEAFHVFKVARVNRDASVNDKFSDDVTQYRGTSSSILVRLQGKKGVAIVCSFILTFCKNVCV